MLALLACRVVEGSLAMHRQGLADPSLLLLRLLAETHVRLVEVAFVDALKGEAEPSRSALERVELILASVEGLRAETTELVRALPLLDELPRPW